MENLSKIIRVGLVLILIILSCITILLLHKTFPIINAHIINIYGILKPLIFGFGLAFLLHPVVGRLEQQGMNRLWAVILVFLLFMIGFGYLLSVFIPILFKQAKELLEQLPFYYQKIEKYLEQGWQKLTFIPENYHFTLDDIEQYVEKKVSKLRFRNEQLKALIESFSVFFLTPVACFYFLYEFEHIKKKLKRFLNQNQYRLIHKFLVDLEYGIGSYFRGLFWVMLILTILSTGVFMWLKLPYPAFLGLIVGITNIIPVIGPFLGGIPAVLLALTKSLKLSIITTLIIIAIQSVEANIITPYIQSKAIKAHPLLILLAFIFFSKICGFMGMLLSIPLLYVVLLMVRYVRLYRRLKHFKSNIRNIENV